AARQRQRIMNESWQALGRQSCDCVDLDGTADLPSFFLYWNAFEMLEGTSGVAMHLMQMDRRGDLRVGCNFFRERCPRPIQRAEADDQNQGREPDDRDEV
ncbi:MAG: hypothetical protein ACM3O2_00075, partial [Syntrophothermus sp.]